MNDFVFELCHRTSLDFDCKKWRLFADALNDFAFFIDLISPLFPMDMVVFVLCLSSVFRSLVSACRAQPRTFFLYIIFLKYSLIISYF